MALLYLFLLMCKLMLVNSSSYMMMQQQPPLCHDDERSALLEFKRNFLIDDFASGDPSAYPKVEKWECARGSRGSCDCCSWDGVECDAETGHVIGLHLASSCLYGSIDSTSSLFHLVHLRRLDLSDNYFNQSAIPNGIGQLLSLRSLNLSNSGFSGQIPPQLLTLSKLVFLDLSLNPDLQLQKPGLINMAESLTHLKKLHLSMVNISSTVPDSLSNLSSLTSLHLGECGLHGEFPMSIFRLPRLESIRVSVNADLSGYLPEFQESSPLKELYLGNTSFSGELPSSIGNLGSLTDLRMGSCNFSGLVPASLGQLNQLTILDLSNNFFSGQIPPSLANLTQLTHLDLSYNDFSVGTLAWLGQQTKLSVLDLAQTNLTGEIPYPLVNMSRLTILFLSENQLIGQIPPWLNNLTQLTHLDLWNNKLEGPIPTSLFELVNLQLLFLDFNYLNGTFDLNMLSKLKNLADLQLSHNNLSLLSNNSSNATFPKLKILALNSINLTEFPDFLQNQDELEALSLSHNKIHGPIPKWMWNISKETLVALDLSGNFLTGFDQLPAVLPWSRLRSLNLLSNMHHGSLPIPPPSTIEYSVRGNKLSGEIPPSICNLTSLKLLDLTDNDLSGRIPQCLSNFSRSLSVLNLRGNSLHGKIPQINTKANNLKMIDFSENQLQGQLPRSLANCTMLEDLVLGNNMIDDIFPFWLGSLPRLQVLILRSNLFHGAIGNPKTNFEFSRLRIIDLSYNSFTGNLPSKYFQTWDAMKILDADKLIYMQAYTGFEDQGYRLDDSFQFSMTIMNKGMPREYEGISNMLVAVDLSSNKFYGEIPESIGNPRGLRWLNLSNNALTGTIPTSLADLTVLEAVDLSHNKLSGEIPQQLVELTFLSSFDVSHNHLTGPIPQGKQFGTYPNSFFEGNLGLCGSPLSKTCESSTGPSPPPPPPSPSSEFDWKTVLMGYASGLVIGVSIGYCLTVWKHEWFVKTFGRQQRKQRTKKRSGNRA